MVTRKPQPLPPTGRCGICGGPVDREGARLCFTCRTWNRRELTPAAHVYSLGHRHSIDIRPEY